MIIEKEFKVSLGKRLNIELAGGTIDVTGWDQELVSIKARSVGGEWMNCKVDVYESASGIEIYSRHDGNIISHLNNFEFKIKVPKRFDIQIKLGGGEISIASVEGDMRGQTSGGNLNLRDLKGALNLETMGGNISLINSEVNGKVKTLAGQVLMQDVRGDVECSSMAGEVVYSKPAKDTHNFKDEVQVSLMAGEINVDDAPAGANISTLAGNINVRSAARYVKAQTNAGDINIDAVDGWVQARTMAGGISITMIGQPEQGKRDVDISSMGRVTNLTLPADLSMEFDIALAQTIDSNRDYQIISDFDIQQNSSGEWVYDQGTPRKYLYGTGSIAGGKNRITIRTVNGDVCLKKGT